MEKICKLIKQKPFISVIIILMLSTVCIYLPLGNFLCKIVDEQSADYLGGFIEQTLVSIALIYLIKRMNLLKKAGFTVQVKDWWVIWPAVLLTLMGLSDWIGGEFVLDTSKPMAILTFVLVYLSTGLLEETLCRGFMMTLFTEKYGTSKKVIYHVVIVTGAIFGALHLIHYFLGQMSLLSAIAQALYAMCFGIFFGACRVRNHSIIPVMIWHGMVDIAFSLDEVGIGGGIDKAYIDIPVSGAIGQVLLALPFLIYGLFLIRKCGKGFYEKETTDC